MTVNLLSRISLFSDLPHSELDKLVAALDVKEMKDRDILFREGDPGEHFFIVLKGELEVLMAEGQMEELLLNVMGEGEHFGEMSLILPGGHRTATVRSRGSSTLLSMSRARFMELTTEYPQLSTSMVRVLSQRLDATNTQTFRDLTDKNRQLQTAYDELKAAQAQLIEKERLERELQVAADIQFSILPDELPKVAEFDFGARILPARQVGGDFYDIFMVAENRVGIMIGDVADKGIPSAIFMARTHALIMAEADTGMNAREVMQIVNHHITRLQKTTQFVTVLYGILDLQTRVFEYARAGHEPPLILNPDGSVERISHSSGMALGLWDTVTLDVRSVTLPPGSTFLLFTDGMTDCRDTQGEPFGLERIKKTLGDLANVSAQHACDHLLATLVNFQDGSKQDDDVTLVAIRAVK
ncbi:MAG: SpoIIE family protein phosphatase [Chloroflexi bacterium]|nr:SpoIIE family protein phosphatase [Chloroflexota bacterium]